MDTNTNFRITIPKPCHEDWNKFTPDEKGAFCKVCSKSVHDFTKKQPEEIKTILIEEMSAGNKVCGRFNEDQIDNVRTSYMRSQPMDTYALNFRRMKRFAVALFLVFGGYLFNSIKSSAQKTIMGKMPLPQYNYPIRGEIAIAKDPEPVVKDTAKKIICEMPKGDVKITPIEKLSVLGGVKAMPMEEPTIKGNAVIEQSKGQVVIIETPPTITGSVAITEDIDIKDIIEPLMGDTILGVETMETVEEPMIMGMMVAEPYIVEPPALIDPIPSDSIAQIIDGEFAVVESTFVETGTQTIKGEEEIKISDEVIDINLPKIDCYPNPFSETTSLRITNFPITNLQLCIYNMYGEKVKEETIRNSPFVISRGNLPDGIYFCELISGNNKSTARIVIAK